MKKWIQLLVIILIFASVSVGIYFILKAFNLTDINTIKQVVKNSKQYGWIVFLCITTIVPILLCFIPLLNPGLSLLCLHLYGVMPTFALMITSNIISTIILFLLGDKLGEGITRRLVGQSALNRAQNLINHKSKILLPILFVIPIFPHEAITLVASMTKLKYWYIALVNVLHVIIETSVMCFLGSGVISWSSLSVLDWIMLTNILIIDISYLFKLEKKFNDKNCKT